MRRWGCSRSRSTSSRRASSGPTAPWPRCCGHGNGPPPDPSPVATGEGQGRGSRFARRALELADETPAPAIPIERDYVRAHWLLGAALAADGDLDGADRHLTEALARCRRINVVDPEADILLDLARVRWGTGRAGERDERGIPRLRPANGAGLRSG